MVEQDLFQNLGGGSIPTSPLQLKYRITNRATAKRAYKEWHYFGDKGFLSSVDYGVYFNNILFGCISYGIPNARNINNIYDEKSQKFYFELTRFALSELCPKNSESRTIGITLKLLKKKYPHLKGVITYADTKYNHTGIIYKASNFQYLGLTAQKTDLFINGKMVGRLKGKRYSELGGEWIPRSRKHLFIKKFI